MNEQIKGNEEEDGMNKNAVFIIFTVLAVAIILFWARSSSRQPGISENRRVMEAQTVNGPARPRSPQEYAAMMTALSKDMSAWPSLGAPDKRLAVAAVIELYQQQGKGVIKKPAEFYVARLDEALAANEAMRNFPLDRALLFLAVMEYDFDNGKDPDQVAREFLSPEMYAANKARLEKQASPADAAAAK